jgi:hypothetical protein
MSTVFVVLAPGVLTPACSHPVQGLRSLPAASFWLLPLTPFASNWAKHPLSPRLGRAGGWDLAGNTLGPEQFCPSALSPGPHAVLVLSDLPDPTGLLATAHPSKASGQGQPDISPICGSPLPWELHAGA